MHHVQHHHPVFVVLSLGIAILGSWTALDLFRQVAVHIGRARLFWLAAAALAMGTSIWSMHFVAMLGFDPGSAVSYDPLLTAVSLLLAIGATGGAFFFAAADGARTGHVLAAGVAMGGGICLMHYVGMAALTSAVSLGYDTRFVALSLAIAIAAATAALFAVRTQHSAARQAFGALILGLAIVGMHYTAMAALELTPIGAAAEAPREPPYALAFAVAAATGGILFLGILVSLYEQRGNILSALEAGGVGYFELDLRSWALHLSAPGRAMFGLPAQGRLRYADALAKIVEQNLAEREANVRHALEAGTDYDVEYPLAAGGRWINARGRGAASRGGRPKRMVGVVIDVTERRQALARIIESERRQRVLINELNHRVKNTLATVQAISRQTANSAASPAEFHAAFEARLMALSSTHNALTRGGWESASLAEILEHELRPYARERVSVRGEDVALGAREALALGMVLHELATNAVKHGGLSQADGHLEIEWSVAEAESGRTLVLNWTEHGRPILEMPTRTGFGSRLIQGSIERELGGTATMRFEPGGLACRLTVPLREAMAFDMAAE